MSFFQQLEGDGAVLIENGVYVQVPLYQRGYPIFRVGTHQNEPARKSLSKVDRLIP